MKTLVLSHLLKRIHGFKTTGERMSRCQLADRCSPVCVCVCVCVRVCVCQVCCRVWVIVECCSTVRSRVGWAMTRRWSAAAGGAAPCPHPWHSTSDATCPVKPSSSMRRLTTTARIMRRTYMQLWSRFVCPVFVSSQFVVQAQHSVHCVCACVWPDVWPSYLAWWLTVTLYRSSSLI